jgi:tetraacyldisaccharide 4'-kinase
MRGWFERTLTAIWFNQADSNGVFARFLKLPLWMVGNFSKPFILSKSRRQFQAKQLPTGEAKPVIVVVGNLVVGGAGKTPLAIALGQGLAERGLRVAYIASGYGSPAYEVASLIEPTSTAEEVGDEPMLIHLKTGAPVGVGKDRPKTVALLSAAHDLDVIMSDDGLQHEALARHIEIVVFDDRFAGNGSLLPAGPLREPLQRLAIVDAVFAPESLYPKVNEFIDLTRTDLSTSIWALQGFCQLQNYGKPDDSNPSVDTIISIDQFQQLISAQPLHAIAGMANPDKFRDTLAKHGFDAILHAPGDHAKPDQNLIKQLQGNTVVMTEKDAVKYKQLLSHADLDMSGVWVAVGNAEINQQCIESIYSRVQNHLQRNVTDVTNVTNTNNGS